MEMNQKQWNKLLVYAKIIVGGDEDESQDLLQNFLLFMLENQDKYPNINNSFCFKTMKNIFLLEIQKNNRNFRKNFYEDYFHFNSQNELTTEEDIEIIKENDKTIQSKLNSVAETYDELKTYDKQLYYLHFVKGLSQRLISRETGIQLIQIHYRVKKIKEKIIANHNKKENGKENNNQDSNS